MNLRDIGHAPTPEDFSHFSAPTFHVPTEQDGDDVTAPDKVVGNLGAPLDDFDFLFADADTEVDGDARTSTVAADDGGGASTAGDEGRDSTADGGSKDVAVEEVRRRRYCVCCLRC